MQRHLRRAGLVIVRGGMPPRRETKNEFIHHHSGRLRYGTYHQYNCGSIFGKWFDLTDFDDEDAFYDACRTLHAGEEDPELMFQDWEGIPSPFASESSVKWAFIEAFRRHR
jgi:antirestriction protein